MASPSPAIPYWKDQPGHNWTPSPWNDPSALSTQHSGLPTINIPLIQLPQQSAPRLIHRNPEIVCEADEHEEQVSDLVLNVAFLFAGLWFLFAVVVADRA